MKLKLDQYQRNGANFLTHNKNAILADVMGLGKTAQAIEALKLVKAKKVLIICPAAVKYTWEQELKKWDWDQNNMLLPWSPKHPLPKNLPGTYTLICSYSMIVRSKSLFKLLGQLNFDVIICDEIHKLKEKTSTRTKRIMFARYALLNKTKYFWGLTGTLVMNRPSELYTFLKALSPNRLPAKFHDWINYAYHFCAAYQTTFGLNTSGSKNLPELKQLIDPLYLRRTYKDAGIKVDTPRLITTYTSKLSTSAQGIEKQIQDVLDKNTGTDQATIDHLRSMMALEKADEVAVFIKMLLETENKIVVFAHHKAMIDYLKTHLAKFDPVVVNSTVSSAQKKANLKQFNTGKARVILLNYISASEGIDGLQHAANTMVLAELIWSPEILRQAFARLARRGQTKPVCVYTPIAPGSMDEDYLKMLSKKDTVINTLLGETREGVTSQIKSTVKTVTQIKNDLNPGETIMARKTIDQCLREIIRETVAEEILKVMKDPAAAAASAVASAVEVGTAVHEAVAEKLAEAPQPVATPVASSEAPQAAPASLPVEQPVAPVVEYDAATFNGKLNAILNNIHQSAPAVPMEFITKIQNLMKTKYNVGFIKEITDEAQAKLAIADVIALFDQELGGQYGAFSTLAAAA